MTTIDIVKQDINGLIQDLLKILQQRTEERQLLTALRKELKNHV